MISPEVGEQSWCVDTGEERVEDWLEGRVIFREGTEERQGTREAAASEAAGQPKKQSLENV